MIKLIDPKRHSSQLVPKGAWCDLVLGRQIGTIMIQEGTHMQHIPARFDISDIFANSRYLQIKKMSEIHGYLLGWEGVSLKKQSGSCED